MVTRAMVGAVVLGIVMLALLPVALRMRSRFSGQVVARDRGRIGPAKGLVSALVLALLGGVALSFYAFIDGSGGIEALIVALGALLLAAASGCCLLPIYDVVWSARGIEGPTSLWFPPIGPRRSFIAWEEVALVGVDKGCYVEDRQGRRIRWNQIYAGAPALTLHLERVLPWILGELPPGGRVED